VKFANLKEPAIIFTILKIDKCWKFLLISEDKKMQKNKMTEL